MPTYRLQTLLEIRQRAKEAAEQAFSEAVREVTKQEKELKRLEDDLTARKADRKRKVELYMQEVMSKGTGISGMNSMNRYETRLKDEEAQVGLDIERQREVLKRAQRVMEEKRQEMAQAAMDLKAIEKHQEKWKKEVRLAREAREDLAQEEIGNTLHLQRSRAESE